MSRLGSEFSPRGEKAIRTCSIRSELALEVKRLCAHVTYITYITSDLAVEVKRQKSVVSRWACRTRLDCGVSTISTRDPLAP